MRLYIILLKMRPLVPLRSHTDEKTCGKHVFTYQLAVTVASVSNGTGLIKPDLLGSSSIIFHTTSIVCSFRDVEGRSERGASSTLNLLR